MAKHPLNAFERCKELIRSFKPADLASIDVLIHGFAQFEAAVQLCIKQTLEDISALQREEKELVDAEQEFI